MLREFIQQITSVWELTKWRPLHCSRVSVLDGTDFSRFTPSVTQNLKNVNIGDLKSVLTQQKLLQATSYKQIIN